VYKNLRPISLGIDATLLEGLELAKATGYEGLEVDILEVEQLVQKNSVKYLKDLFKQAGIKAGSWKLPVDWRSDDSEYYDELSKLPGRAELAAEFESHRSWTVVRGWDDSLPFKENWDFHVKRLRPPAEILKDYGHSLAFEFIGPYTSRAPHRYNFLYTMDGVLALAAAIGTGNAGLLFDVWHCYTSHATLDDLRKLSKDDIVYVHINDAPAGIEINDQIDTVRALPGETGIIPLPEILRFLKDVGYDGPVMPEPFYKKLEEMTPEEAARTVSEALDKVWREAGI
jgi:sugar phosphate isomerase/epimerase